MIWYGITDADDTDLPTGFAIEFIVAFAHCCVLSYVVNGLVATPTASRMGLVRAETATVAAADDRLLPGEQSGGSRVLFTSRCNLVSGTKDTAVGSALRHYGLVGLCKLCVPLCDWDVCRFCITRRLTRLLQVTLFVRREI